MYARCLRRSAATSFLRRNTPPSIRRRCLASVESSPATSDSKLPPSASKAEPIQNIDSWDSVLGASVDNTNSQSVIPDAPAVDISEELSEKEDIEHEEDQEVTEPQGKQARETYRSPGIVIITGQKSKHMPGVLSIVQQIEKLFGRVREFRVLRDKDSPTDYLTTLFITFHDIASMEKVRHELQGETSGKIMLDPPPDWDCSRQLEGGVRLGDIQPFLRPSASEEATVHDSDTAGRSQQEVVDAVSKESDGAVPDNSNQVAASTSVDRNECFIRIRPDSQPCTPFLYDRKSRLSRDPEHRSRMARAFIHWSGFYPHYHFYDLKVEERTKSPSNARVSEEASGTVQLATQAMSSAILRFRLRLRDFGDPNHGLTHRDGRAMMPEWEMPVVKTEKSEPVITPSPEQPEPVQPEPTTSITDTDKAKLSNTKWEKPKPLTPEEEESLQRLFARSSLLRSQRVPNPADPPTKLAKTESKAPPTASIRDDPQPSSPSESTAESTLEQSQGSPLAETSATTLPSTDSEEQTENNRSRRARKKAEQKKAGFKGKLLGWLSR